jgi:hypothetical protein
LIASLIDLEDYTGYEFSSLPIYFNNKWYAGGTPLVFQYVLPTEEPVSEFCQYSQAGLGLKTLLGKNLFHNSFSERNLVFSKTDRVKISFINRSPRVSRIEERIPGETGIMIFPAMRLVDIGSLVRIDKPDPHYISIMEKNFGCEQYQRRICERKS